MTGPIFRYDGSNPSPSQFPPQFDYKLLVSGCVNFGFHLLAPDSDLDTTTQDVAIFARFPRNTLVDLTQGPDGAVYYLNYGAGIDGIRYTGTCKEPSFLPEKPVGVSAAFLTPEADWLRLESRSLAITAPGGHGVEVLDVNGRSVLAFSGEGEMRYSLDAVRYAGVYMVRVTTSRGTAERRLIRFGDR